MSQILLIESDRLLASNITEVVQGSGHRVKWQVDLQSAIESVDAQHPDLIILDLMLAGRSGAEFLYELRSYPEWQSLPVIIFSDVARADLADSSISLEDLAISQFLYKPTSSLNDLLQAVNQALSVVTKN